MPVVLGCPVRRVRWGDSGRARLDTPKGTVQAKTAIVTVPVAVLADGRPSFIPPLPASHRNAIEGLPTGAVAKIGLGFSRDVFGGVSINTLATHLYRGTALRAVQARYWGRNVGIVVVGGAFVRDLEKAGRQAVIDHALETVKRVFGGRPERHVIAARPSLWVTDP